MKHWIHINKTLDFQLYALQENVYNCSAEKLLLHQQFESEKKKKGTREKNKGNKRNETVITSNCNYNYRNKRQQNRRNINDLMYPLLQHRSIGTSFGSSFTQLQHHHYHQTRYCFHKSPSVNAAAVASINCLIVVRVRVSECFKGNNIFLYTRIYIQFTAPIRVSWLVQLLFVSNQRKQKKNEKIENLKPKKNDLVWICLKYWSSVFRWQGT